MEWISIILEVFIMVLLIMLGYSFKNFFPSYLDEKGKNLATKQDIEIITRKTEEVQKEFKEGFELFSSDVHFKYDFYFKQYSELYSKLYGIIMQSEYLRYFIRINNGQEISFEEAPFIEILPTHKTTKTLNFGHKNPAKIQVKEEIVETPLSNFNKKQLCEYIIDNAEYATQKLLKIAVAYRFANFYYTGNSEASMTPWQDTANEEEFRLIKEVVCCIVSEYNFFRKELKMTYNEIELETGIPQLE